MLASRSRFFAGPALLALLVLVGCATPAPYAPRGPGMATGYTDRQLSDNRWRVTFTGNSVTPRETVENDLLLSSLERTARCNNVASTQHISKRRWLQPVRG